MLTSGLIPDPHHKPLTVFLYKEKLWQDAVSAPFFNGDASKWRWWIPCDAFESQEEKKCCFLEEVGSRVLGRTLHVFHSDVRSDARARVLHVPSGLAVQPLNISWLVPRFFLLQMEKYLLHQLSCFIQSAVLLRVLLTHWMWSVSTLTVCVWGGDRRRVWGLSAPLSASPFDHLSVL